MDLTAITTRDDFLLELGEALGGQASVRPVDSIGGALEYIQGVKRGQVLVVDTRDLTDVRADVDRSAPPKAHYARSVYCARSRLDRSGSAWPAIRLLKCSVV